MRLPGRGARAVLVAAAMLAVLPASALALLAPREATSASVRGFVNVLGRVAPGSRVTVAGEPAAVFATGIFVRDRVPLAEGGNRIVVTATAPDGSVQERVLEVERVAPPPPPPGPSPGRLEIDPESLRPRETLRLAPGERFEAALRATPGQRAEVQLPGSARWWPLPETAPGSGQYRALLVLPEGAPAGDGPVAALRYRLSALTLPRAAKPRQIVRAGLAGVGLWRDDPDRFYVSGSEGAELLHGLHEVRLGGPFLAELPEGTWLRATGQHGEFLRVQLAPDTTAWVAMRSVAAAEPRRPLAAVHFTALGVASGEEGDVVSIPLASPVPYAVRAVADGSGRVALEVDIFNAHHATTWITHRASNRVVREITAEQAGPARVRVRIQPQAARLWGWRAERTAGALRLHLRAPPPQLGSATPLGGLHIALEAGHGSDANRGAVGATGAMEKDINRATAEQLKTLLEAAGARVTMVREGDQNPALRERARRALESGAQLYLSIHANAADTAQGYLRVSGTSTYYKHATGRELAAAIQRRMLAETGLPDFGLVGNFNYTPIRVLTAMPAVLVELAFLSHPGDEALMLEPAFRERMARAIRAGVEDFLRAP